MNVTLLSRVALIMGLSVYLISVMICFQVRQNEQAVVTRFGKPVHIITKPGLYVKWPWPIEAVSRLDTRLNFYEIRLSESLTKDRRNVIVPVFVAWRITDPLRFLESVGTPNNVRNKLDSLVSSAKNTILGIYDFKQLVSISDDDIKLPEIEQKLTEFTADQAKNSFGVEIQQVGIERITLPEANTGYVFDRMRAERSQFAERYLAEGRQQADAIKANADAQRTVILADAQKQAEIKRGSAEATAAQIYSKAHSQSPDFYQFLRELDSLKKTITQNTTLVLDANQAPYDLLQTRQTSPDHESEKK